MQQKLLWSCSYEGSNWRNDNDGKNSENVDAVTQLIKNVVSDYIDSKCWVMKLNTAVTEWIIKNWKFTKLLISSSYVNKTK